MHIWPLKGQEKVFRKQVKMRLEAICEIHFEDPHLDVTEKEEGKGSQYSKIGENSAMIKHIYSQLNIYIYLLKGFKKLIWKDYEKTINFGLSPKLHFF